MPRHSNKDLTAERKQLVEIFSPEKDESLVDAAIRTVEAAELIMEDHMRLKAQLEALQSSRLTSDTPPIPAIPMPQPSQTASALVPPHPPPPASALDDRPRSAPPTSTAPLDAAYYPPLGQPVAAEKFHNWHPPADGEGPPMSASQGDMTPAYVRWFLAEKGPDATRAKYGPQRPEELGRLHLLPDDVRRALA